MRLDAAVKAWRRVVVLGLAVCFSAIVTAASAEAGILGANKFDLMLDYVSPRPPAGADPEGYRRVRVAMAQKAILDARDVGLRFLRVAVTGFGPPTYGGGNDLPLWQSNAPQFWARLDQMFDDLDAAGIQLVPSFVWNITQFPSITGDSVGTFIRDPKSAGRDLITRYIDEFITRYKARKTILFYEMGNELNLQADLDNRKRNCHQERCVWDNFSSSELLEFGRQIAFKIKALDPSRGVSSGYAMPRAAAAHLKDHPEYSRGGPDWTPDAESEFENQLLSMHAPFDIISIHVYPADTMRQGGASFDRVLAATKAAHRAGKLLFIGEFGDEHGATPFVAQVMREIVSEQIDLAAVWVWEFYQYTTYNPAPFNVEPGLTPAIIRELRELAGRLGTGGHPELVSAPRVVLTWPLPCARINRAVELAATASDGTKAAAKVEFMLDGEVIGLASAPPFRALFDPSGRGSKLAVMSARAIGEAGATAEFSSNVKLNDADARCVASRGGGL